MSSDNAAPEKDKMNAAVNVRAEDGKVVVTMTMPYAPEEAVADWLDKHILPAVKQYAEMYFGPVPEGYTVKHRDFFQMGLSRLNPTQAAILHSLITIGSGVYANMGTPEVINELRMQIVGLVGKLRAEEPDGSKATGFIPIVMHQMQDFISSEFRLAEELEDLRDVQASNPKALAMSDLGRMASTPRDASTVFGGAKAPDVVS